VHWIEEATSEDADFGDVSAKLEPRNMEPGRTVPEKPKTSVEAFNQVLKMMNETPPASGTEVRTLCEEVDELKRELRAQDEQCSTLQANHSRAVEINEEQRAAVNIAAEELAAAEQSHTSLESEYLANNAALRNRLQVAYGFAKNDRAVAA
jgi:hypothetical protein